MPVSALSVSKLASRCLGRCSLVSCVSVHSTPCVFPASASGYRNFSEGAKKQSPVKKKEKSGGKDTESERTKELNVIFAALDAPERKEPPVSEEEKARRAVIGRNYTIGRFRFHNEIHHDLTNKLHLKKHAIKMLPRHGMLREEALKDNDEMPPQWRPIPVWTPPIPGFDASQYNVKEDEK